MDDIEREMKRIDGKLKGGWDQFYKKKVANFGITNE